jgi:hypothetical protein
MNEQDRKKELSKVPTRKLLATLKQDIRRQLKAPSSPPKLKKLK